jgi:hypothetical protein
MSRLVVGPDPYVDLAEVDLDLSSAGIHRPSRRSATLHGVGDGIQAVGEIEVQREASPWLGPPGAAPVDAPSRNGSKSESCPDSGSQLEHEPVGPRTDAGDQQARGHRRERIR